MIIKSSTTLRNDYRAAVEFAFECIVCHAANDPFGEVGGVVFRITFKDGFEDDAFRRYKTIQGVDTPETA